MGTLSCTICSEIYKNSDDIYSTTCGHVFHFSCMRQWQSRSTTCPQCREYNPQSHKIFLSFDEPTDTDQKIFELKSQLENSISNSSELQHQLDQTERNLLEMQLALSNGEESSRELNEKIRYLTIQNESREPKEENGNKPEINGGEIQLRQKIKVLEARLKQVSLQLENEIKNSTELTVDKMKLQSLLQQLSAASVTTSNLFGCPKPTTEADHGNKSVVIRGLSEKSLAGPLEIIVLKLAQVMGLQFTKDDIESVFKLEKNFQNRHHIQNGIPSMVVKFRDLDRKIKFLSNKHVLKNKPETAQIIIYEYVTDTVHTLFYYAKTLKIAGYKSVYCRNNAVFVKKTNTTPAIKIANKLQVDEMLKSSNDAKQDLVSSAGDNKLDVTGGGHVCDESFYDIL